MESPVRSLITDDSRYVEAWRLFLRRSTQPQCMQQFIQNKLPDIVSSLGNGKPLIRVLSVGGGSGEIDLQILSVMQDQYPRATIHNTVIEPKLEQILNYKEKVGQTRDLGHVKFYWHHKNSLEFELEVNESKKNTKYDFIHMIQVMYYVKDLASTLQFYRSLLAPNGKLLIVHISGRRGWSTLWKKYRQYLPFNDHFLYITTGDITGLLSSMGARYQCYDLESEVDMTECFTEGDRNGELLLDLLTGINEFKKNIEQKDEIIQYLRSPGCSSIKDGKIVFNNNIGVIVVENE